MSLNINWIDVIKKEARGLNDADFGEVQEVSNGLILTQRGIVNKELFSIPQTAVESYDGKVLKFNISENEAVDKYKKLFEPRPIEIGIGSDTKPDIVTTSADSTKIEGIIDETVDDALKNELIQPTKEEVDLEIEKAVEKEVAGLNKETGVENKPINPTISGEQIPHENTMKSTTNKNEKSSKIVTEGNEEETPLKKEEAGIA